VSEASLVIVMDSEFEKLTFMCTHATPFQILELEYKLKQPSQSDSEVAVLKLTVIYQLLSATTISVVVGFICIKIYFPFLSFRQIKELELKLEEQEHLRSAAELKVSCRNMCLCPSNLPVIINDSTCRLR
jgi:hypothetical protein